MNEQTSLFTDNPEYDAFVEKFKPKKTTDDCYTPPEIYNVIRDWACEKYGIDPASIVRPFWPGGDYEVFDYPEGCTVLDNPPFSILSKICAFYLERGIKFFLFAPSLTCFSGRQNTMRMNHIVCQCTVVYENGATVPTSFVTIYGGDIVAQTAPDLERLVNDTADRLRHERTKELPKYSYPDNIVTPALLRRYSHYGIDLKIHRGDCTPIYTLDAQRPEKKAIFGGGLLLSERAAAVKWPLSEREKEIIKTLG